MNSSSDPVWGLQESGELQGIRVNLDWTARSTERVHQIKTDHFPRAVLVVSLKRVDRPSGESWSYDNEHVIVYPVFLPNPKKAPLRYERCTDIGHRSHNLRQIHVVSTPYLYKQRTKSNLEQTMSKIYTLNSVNIKYIPNKYKKSTERIRNMFLTCSVAVR